MARTLSLTVPSGHLTLGNLLGAISHWTEDQRGGDSLYGIADLHALTTEHDPRTVQSLTLEQAALLVAAGLDPRRCTVFVQSQVPGRASGAARASWHRLASGQAQVRAGAERSIVTYQQPPARFSAAMTRKKAAHP